MSDTEAEAPELPAGLDQGIETGPRSAGPGEPSGTRLAGRVALVAGGEAGLGREVAVRLAREGADVAILHLNSDPDAAETVRRIEATGRRALALAGDVSDPSFCRAAVAETIDTLGAIDILVNGAGDPFMADLLEQVTQPRLESGFRGSVFAQFHLTRAALPLIPDDGAIINTAPTTGLRGEAVSIDGASTVGAVIGFTRALAASLVPRRIRVNAVAPVGRAPPEELAPFYVFLASTDAFLSGHVLRPGDDRIVPD